MRQEEGKGFIKLILAVAVMVVIIILGVRYAKDFIKDENAKDLQADLLLVQNKVEIIKGNNSMNSEQSPLKGYQLSQLPEGINITEFLEKNIIPQEEYEKYYLLDSRKFRTNEFTGISK